MLPRQRQFARESDKTEAPNADFLRALQQMLQKSPASDPDEKSNEIIVNKAFARVIPFRKYHAQGQKLPFHVVVFVDKECPHCRRFLPQFQQITDAIVKNSKKLKFPKQFRVFAVNPPVESDDDTSVKIDGVPTVKMFFLNEELPVDSGLVRDGKNLKMALEDIYGRYFNAWKTKTNQAMAEDLEKSRARELQDPESPYLQMLHAFNQWQSKNADSIERSPELTR